MLDVIPIFLWGLIILVSSYFVRNSKEDLPHYKYYFPNLYAKLFFATAFGVFYLFVVGGGDTAAYFDGAKVMSNLFLKDPGLYFEQLFSAYNPDMDHYYYDMYTGYPPGWIYREEEGFFIVKIMSVLSLITLKSYFAMTLVMAWITSLASWKLFEFIRSLKINNEKYLAFGILLLPSINFWCAGISKDSVVFVSAIILVVNAFKIISKEQKSSFKNLVYVFATGYIIYNVRPFILGAIMIPMLFSLAARIVKALGGGENAVVATRTIFLILGLGVGGQTLLNTPESELLESSSYLKEAAVIQDDFAHNKSYGDKKYDIGSIEFTPLGLVKVAPMAIIAGMYYPFLWQALNPTLLMNGLESIVFLYFTFLFFKDKLFEKWKKVRSHEFLIFCLIFVFIIAYMTGLTSGLYGVLVRLRAPLLPFLFVVLTIDFDKIQLEERKKEKPKRL